MPHIKRVKGDRGRRAAVSFYFSRHYMGGDGGSGYTFAVEDGAEIIGAVKIGPPSSMGAVRSLVSPPLTVWNIKRLHCLDDCPVYESALLRHAMREVANERDETILYCAYADPMAVDSRTGNPLTGKVYQTAFFFYAGLTSQPRYAIIDHLGRARSTRQGSITLTRRTLPIMGDTFHGEFVTANWQMMKVPAARVWLAVVSPDSYTRRRRRAAFFGVWRALNPERRVAARMWLTLPEIRRLQRRGRQLLGALGPRHTRVSYHDVGRALPIAESRFYQGGQWRGDELRGQIAPIWVPYPHQGRLLEAFDVADETTAGRIYLPRVLAQQQAAIAPVR